MANAKKSVKNSKGVATKATKKVTPIVVVSEEVVLDAKADITEVIEEVVTSTIQEGYAVCSTCKDAKEQVGANFSPMAKGGFRNICKPCQTQASGAWTTKRADYRKQYQRANQLINLGIPALVPNARTWSEGDVIMTLEYTRNGETFPSRIAEEVYAEMKQSQADSRAETKAQIESQNAELKQQRADARAEAKEQRDNEKAEAKANRVAERAEAKTQRDAERAEQAEEARLERERKDAERTEARNQKAIDSANAIAEKEATRRQAAIDKALAVSV